MVENQTQLRRLRKQPVGARNDWDFTAEPGDRVYQRARGGADYVYMYDLRESRGRDKAAMGELTPHLVKGRNGLGRHAVLCDDGHWYWND